MVCILKDRKKDVLAVSNHTESEPFSPIAIATGKAAECPRAKAPVYESPPILKPILTGGPWRLSAVSSGRSGRRPLPSNRRPRARAVANAVRLGDCALLQCKPLDDCET